MLDTSFVHLRLHSEYSISDGIVRVDEAVARAVELGMPALALTDLANVFGLVKFYQACRSHGVKPVIGCDVHLSNDQDRDKPHRLLLLCQDHAGYLRLCDLLTRAYRGNRRRGRAELRREWFAEGTEGLLALSGAAAGEVGQALLADNLVAAERACLELAGLFPGRLYIELQRTGAAECAPYVARAVRLARRLELPLVATHPVQFLGPDDFKAHEARVCISQGHILADQRRPRPFTPEQYFKTPQQMATLFADLPAALANSVEIARRCSLKIELGRSRLPDFPTPGGVTLDDYLGQRARQGLAERLVQLFPDATERERQTPRYQERLELEVSMVVRMGFPGYFLIVADFINWAKQNDVPVGPGRGSGAGSLVAYCLGITDLDPIRYDLLFERFLNPERVSMPDFDVDFCQDGRERVIDYVKRTYGADCVSQIATFGTMAAKAVVRDVGRVLDLPYNFVDQLAKLVPFELGITLARAREQEPLLNERAQKEEEVRELLDLAQRLEGLTRNVGMHAGGVLIAPGKLTDFCPLYCADGSEAVVSQFDKDDVEQAGLVKFDFLGLRTLTILDWAVRFIHQGARPDFRLEDIPLTDPASFHVFVSGNTTAVFQSESRSAKDLGRKLRPDNFEDIIALMALNRPGPLQSGMVDDFIARKQGKQKAEYFHPSLEPVLKPTYGVIVYQEQVMQIAQVLAGYSLGQADLLRRAMGKKKAEEMAQQRDLFVSRSVERGVLQSLAEHLFDLMAKFAQYGFNKSHSAAYALVAFQTAFLKAHHPAAFMAATLSSEMDDTDKVRIFHEDCLENRIEVLPPDVNHSVYRFVPVSLKAIRYGLGAIKGTGESAINTIVRAREAAGLFADLFDFCRRVDRRVVNRRVIESLIRAGAFDGLGPDRARLLASVGLALEEGERAAHSVVQGSLFGSDDPSSGEAPTLVRAPPWSERERLAFEKQALGFYLSGHPFNASAPDLARFVRTRLSGITPSREALLLAGVVAGVRIASTRRGRMAIIQLEDGTARVDVAVFNELFEANRALLKEDLLLVVEGRPEHDDFTGGIRVTADKLYDLDGVRARFARRVELTCNGGSNGARLRELLAPYRSGNCMVRVTYSNSDAICQVDLGDAWRVAPQETLLQILSDWLAPENVRVVYQNEA